MRVDQRAAQAWDRVESLADTKRRIHDFTSSDSELAARSRSFVSDLIFGNFPHSTPRAGAAILEIGSGVGEIMRAMNDYLSAETASPERIVGLDIAPNMLAKARECLGDRPPYAFQLYDGLTIPFDDGTFDLIYSVACFQHVPRPYVFNLFFEIKRLLKQRGFAVLQFLSTDALQKQEEWHPWRKEIENQVGERNEHWHHFYTAKEVRDVLAITGFGSVAVKDDGVGCLVACVGTDPIEQPPKRDDTAPPRWFRLPGRAPKR